MLLSWLNGFNRVIEWELEQRAPDAAADWNFLLTIRADLSAFIPLSPFNHILHQLSKYSRKNFCYCSSISSVFLHLGMGNGDNSSAKYSE